MILWYSLKFLFLYLISYLLNAGQVQLFFQRFIDDSGIDQTPVAWITIIVKVDINFSHKDSCSVANLTVSPVINYIFEFVIFCTQGFENTVGH